MLCIAAQLITISALLGVDPPPASWASLLLAIAPAPLAAAAFAPVRFGWLAAAAGSAVLVTGIGGAWDHTGLFFVPALVALAAGGAMLWRERS